MKTSHIFWGTLFITIGLLVLINNFTPILMDWSTIWKLWPMVIILLGLSIIIKHRYGKGVIAGLAAFVLAFSIFASVKSSIHFFSNDFNVILDDDAIDSTEIQYLSEEFDSKITKAVLSFDAGAGSFKLSDTTDKLISAQIQSRKHDYQLEKITVNSSAEINIEMADVKFNIGGKGYVNRVDLALNPQPVWDLNFGVGAAKLIINLTEFKVNDVNIDMGAASVDLTIGEKMEKTNVNIEAGASDINVIVPKNSGCEVNISSALSSKQLNGFNKLNSGLYRTENFESAEKKVHITIECGVSAINVERN